MQKLLFVNLMAFYRTGGLEKFNRCFLKALHNISGQLNIQTYSTSLCDETANEDYYPQKQYAGYARSKIFFTLNSILKGISSDVIVLGHINTAVIGVALKAIFPKKKLVLICHGIEVWEPVTGLKKKLIDNTDKIFAVSEYTRQQIIRKQGKAADKVAVLHNTIDPYFDYPATFDKSEDLVNRYSISKDDFIVYTLCRLSSKEQYKGYDAVIKAVAKLAEKYTNIKYLLAGKYDDEEKARLDLLIRDLKLDDKVIFAGYIDDAEITAHYQLADVFIMPSTGEGFGIVFIEAMACGRNVIAGNSDGSVDALRNGELGTIINATDIIAIADALEEKIVKRGEYTDVAASALQQKAKHYFGFDAYQQTLKNLLTPILN